MSQNAAVGDAYLQVVKNQFIYTKSLADRAAAQLTDDELRKEPWPGSNSVAITMKHIAGNQLSRWTDFLTTDGEKASRKRDTEFEDHDWSREETLAHWDRGWAALFDALAGLTPDDLMTDVTIRSEPWNVMAAIERQMGHYGYHVGQIVYLARMLRGDDWETLSVPRGASAAFNEALGHEPE